MILDINFRLNESEKDIDNLASFLLPRPLNYKGYSQWLEKAIAELYCGYKQVALGFSHGKLVASLMFQPHKTIRKFCELKNARTFEEFQNRYMLSFMLRQVEVIAKQQGNLAIVGDARSDRLNVIQLLVTNGYREVARTDLYKEDQEDIMFCKPLGKANQRFSCFPHKVQEKLKNYPSFISSWD